MIALGVSTSLEGSSTSASTVTYTVTGGQLNNGTPPVIQSYEQLGQGQLGSSVGALATNTSSEEMLISSIHLMNTGTTTQTVNLYIGGTASSNQICTLVIPGGGWAEYEDGDGWQTYNAAGLALTGGVLYVGALGTPASSAQSLTASSANVVNGTLFQLATGQLQVGTQFQWDLTVIKTAAGIATWTLAVKYGTAGTTSDSAIATFTSGTNTALADRAFYTVICTITALGSGTSATASCMVHGVNQATDATGLGSMGGAVAGSTAGFNSTATNPYMHIDITPGASAVMTAVGAAQQTHS